VDSSYRAEAGEPHAPGLVEDRLDALLTGSARPVMWDALSSELATQRAGIHPDTLLNPIAACPPRIDIDWINGEPVSGGRTI
jgi:hypothetical protein